MKDVERYQNLVNHRHDQRYADYYTISRVNFDFLLNHYEKHRKLKQDYELLQMELAKSKQRRPSKEMMIPGTSKVNMDRLLTIEKYERYKSMGTTDIVIAKRVGVSRKTLSVWKKENNLTRAYSRGN